MEPAGTPQPTGPLASHDSAQGLANGREPEGARVTRKIEVAGVSDEAPPTVARGAWLRDDDYWRKVTYMSATGRRASDRPETRPLPRPDRFAARSPLRSLATLALVVALIILIPVGVVAAAQEASKLALPANIPGISQPTEVPATLTPSPKPKVTATPSHKK